MTDGSGKARVWDERRAATVAKRVVAARATIPMRGLENGGVPGASLDAGHAFRVHQVGVGVGGYVSLCIHAWLGLA